MKKLKEIEQMLTVKKVAFERSYNNQKIIILACCLGDNFYDYGDTPKKIRIDDEELYFLKDDPRVIIIECCDCCGCASW